MAKIKQEIVNGKICNIYNYEGNEVVYFANSKEIQVNGVRHELAKPFENLDEFKVWCVETNLF